MSILTSSPSTDITPTAQAIGGTVHFYDWCWQNQTFRVVYETLGAGLPVLLLPAFSTVSTRSELRGLAERLAPQFQVTALDWLGFGQSDRPSIDYQAALYHQLLEDFVRDVFAEPVAVVAAGHAAGYVMRLASKGVWSGIALAAPTWRGPLPTMGASRAIATVVRQAVRSPLLGQALYQANTTPNFLRLMYGRHVYVDSTRLTPEFIAQKRQITQQSGARFAPAAFVTGALDPVQSRDEFLSEFQGLSVPVFVAIAAQAPPKSRAEMDVLAEIPGVQAQVLPGTLGLYEEYSDLLADAIVPFLMDLRG